MADGLNLFEEDEQKTEEIPEEQVEIDPQLEVFVNELSENLINLEQIIIDLEKQPTNKEKLNGAFRLFHNTKGSSAMMELVAIKDITHYCESLLDFARKDQMVINSQHIDLFLNAMTALQEILAVLKKTGKEGENRYFSLLAKVVEEIDKVNGGEKKQEQEQEVVELEQKTHSTENEQIKVSRSVIDQMMLLVAEFMLLKNKIIFLKNKYKDRQFVDHCIELDQFSAKMQRNILKLRLSPVKPIFNTMRRVVRTTAQTVSKEISFEISGEETLLDRIILDKLSDPLMHILRNAIDHGIEDVEERLKLNKPPSGNVTLKAGYLAGEVFIHISDDGQGIDPEKMKQVALKKELINENQASNLSNQEAMNLIFLPGFSAAKVVTETSGRGVGMDVVKEALEKVGGRVEIQTEVGIGTTFMIRLPLSLAIIDCLGFEVGNQNYAIPQLNIEEVLSIEAAVVRENLQTLESGSQVLVVRDSVVPILKMGDILEKECSPSAMILVRFGKSRFILEVGKILGPISIVSQPLPPTFSKDAPFSGVTKQGDGSLLFQIDLSKLSEKILSNTTNKARKKSDHNRGTAGVEQEGSLMNSSEIRRLQQKTIFFQSGLHFCVPVQRAKRIVFITRNEIRQIQNGGKSYITLEGATIPLIWVEELILRRKRIDSENYSLLLFNCAESTFGIPMANFMGIERMPENYATDIVERGILGSTIIQNNTTLTLDLPALVSMFKGEAERKPKEVDVDKPKRILCAEDDKFFMTELVASLKGEGFELILCEDGLEAKNKLDNPEFAKTLDLVITDIEMPNMTGLALCRWIKAKPTTKHLPVIAYTAITTKEMKHKMTDAGAFAFISKMAFDDLISEVERVFSGETQESRNATTLGDHSTINDRIVSFKIGETWFALPMESIKEVSPITPSAEIPQNENWLGELTSFRGAMIPVLDLGRYFYGNKFQGPFPIEQAVVEDQRRTFALRVNKIGEVILKSELKAGDGLANLTEEEDRITHFVDAVYKHKNKIISLLSPLNLIELCIPSKEEEKEKGAA